MNKITKINLSNLKKCDQVWVDMPENEKGKLCLKCSNTIIDFRNLTDPEIAEIHLFSEQKVCGLYKKSQLKNPIKKTKILKFNHLKSLYFGIFSFLSFNSFGQENTEPIKTEQTEKKYDPISKRIQKDTISSVGQDSIFISGKLTTEDNEPLPGGNIIIKGTKVGVSTDLHGFYRLNVSKELDSLQKITLIYSYIGFETIEEIIENSINHRTINIKLKHNPDSIIEYVITYKLPFYIRFWNRIKNIF